ncbi:MAG: AraC family transcriptional regulator [Chitinophagaceae bacterium]|nr:MAG: AraC family transcriptional regulator [Chitinophagaceae bacterium]
MLPKLEKVPSLPSSSITVKREITPFMDYPWHYHPEFEIILVEKSFGTRFMGSHIGRFSDGDLMFISPSLPHLWRNDGDFYQGNSDLFVDVYVIHFREDALTKGFFNLPELSHIKKLFLRGQQGVFIHDGIDHDRIASLIKEIVRSSDFKRLSLFLTTLDAIANTEDFDLLSSPGYTNSVNVADTERINLVMNYVMQHYMEEINIREIASLVHLTEASFCRYFKAKTHKTLSQFLNEIRILNASKLLINSNMTITEICYHTGYNNISHFNRQFKFITGMTAKEYAKKYLKESY